MSAPVDLANAVDISNTLAPFSGSAVARAARAVAVSTAQDAILHEYSDTNGARGEDARTWSAFAYFFCVFLVVADTVLVAVLLSWAYTPPFQGRAAQLYATERGQRIDPCECEKNEEEEQMQPALPEHQPEPAETQDYGTTDDDEPVADRVSWVDPAAGHTITLAPVHGQRILCTVGARALGACSGFLWRPEQIRLELVGDRQQVMHVCRLSDNEHERRDQLSSLGRFADVHRLSHNLASSPHRESQEYSEHSMPPGLGALFDDPQLEYEEHGMPGFKRKRRPSRRTSRASRRSSLASRRRRMSSYAMTALTEKTGAQPQGCCGRCGVCWSDTLRLVRIDAEDPRSTFVFFWVVVTVLFWGPCFGGGGLLGTLIGLGLILWVEIAVAVLWFLYPCRLYGCNKPQIDYLLEVQEADLTAPNEALEAPPGTPRGALPGAIDEEGRPDSFCGRTGPFWRANWASRPSPCGRAQVCLMTGLFMAMVVSWIILAFMLFAWRPDSYYVWDRNYAVIREEKEAVRSTAVALQFIYSWPRFASDMRMGFIVDDFTKKCGSMYQGSAEASEVQGWIDRWDVNMAQFNPTPAAGYNSINSWLIRPFRNINVTRPTEGLEGGDTGRAVLAAPAESRLLAFQNVDMSQLWVKGNGISSSGLVGGHGPNGGHHWDGGPQVVFRLAPQDYHRFHSPVTGTISLIRKVSGGYWSTSATAARSENGVLRNERYVILIDTFVAPPGTSTDVGLVAVVAVGSTCTGSVRLFKDDDLSDAADREEPHATEWREGQVVNRGDQLGVFQFGGSTVVVLAEPGRVRLDFDLLHRSLVPVETFVTVRQQFGTALWNEPLGPPPPKSPSDIADPPQACC
eukprot:TRINITY_DN4692_c4_g1_i1.p1 TRINITY_DN4692_c4_g1~~TRINITY_DN4692_c4_g1_i1.p1  ORF type:complete len:876 (+),score=249.69 TRINITY_DN4692_c4_g1_i1:64-2628(+)